MNFRVFRIDLAGKFGIGHSVDRPKLGIGAVTLPLFFRDGLHQMFFGGPLGLPVLEEFATVAVIDLLS